MKDCVTLADITTDRVENEAMRTCKRCEVSQALEAFPINNTLASGILRKHTCNTCRNRQSQVRARLHRENRKPDHLRCPICHNHVSGSKNIVLDHDHDTDEFRGWLCNDCNNGLGKFNDNADMLKRAIKYLS